MEEAKNDEKVEKRESERRSRNVIIHGADEYGNNDQAMKDADQDYVLEILQKIGARGQPQSITRLGAPNDRKMRPLKVEMKTIKEKDEVMGNLRNLKGTEFQFGKISITHDYTTKEREVIRSFVERAKEKSRDDPEYIYKVRGDPKNGLSLVKTARK